MMEKSNGIVSISICAVPFQKEDLQSTSVCKRIPILAMSFSPSQPSIHLGAAAGSYQTPSAPGMVVVDLMTR